MFSTIRTLTCLAALSLIMGCASVTPESLPMNFHASGTITSIKLQEIPSKARGGNSRFETWIEIQVAEGGDGSPLEEFAGNPELVDQFKVGEKVAIEATTSTGRHIGSIRPVLE